MTSNEERFYTLRSKLEGGYRTRHGNNVPDASFSLRFHLGRHAEEFRTKNLSPKIGGEYEVVFIKITTEIDQWQS